MRKSILILLLTLCCITINVYAADEQKSRSTRTERNFIRSGNKSYKQSKYKEALSDYQNALKENPSSLVGAYNLGLTNLRLASSKDVKEDEKKKYESEGSKLLTGVMQSAMLNPELASRSAYNLGNMAFNAEDYQSALQMYKQALRLNPNDNDARRNLRITQLKLQNRNKDKNKDQNKDNKDNQKDKDKQDKQQNQNQNQNQEEKNKQQQKPQSQTPDNQISEQTADQILKAMENKESQTRARVMNPPKSPNASRSRKNW